MHADLDSLRELLKSDAYSLDTNTLLGVCLKDRKNSNLYYNVPYSCNKELNFFSGMYITGKLGMMINSSTKKKVFYKRLLSCYSVYI